MANVIIGIHGLGNKPSKKKLELWWKQAMIEGLKTYNYKAVLPKFELVYWSDILYDKPLSESEKDKHSPYFLEEKYTKATKDFHEEQHNTRKKVVDFIGRQINHIFLNDDLSMNYSFISDIVVEKYFKDLDIYFKEKKELKNGKKYTAKDLINKRLSNIIEKYREDTILLVSHSMGSIIAYEVLDFYTPHIPINTFVTIGSPLGLPIVISKISEKQKQPDNSQNHLKTPTSVSANWYNFSDITDTVAFNYMLADDFSENEKGVKAQDFLVINNYEINGKGNPHKSYGYLRTPEFSKILNEFIQSERLNIFQKISRKSLQFIQALKAQLFI